MQRGRWAHVDAGREQFPREAAIAIAIHVRTELAEVADRRPVGEHDLKHRPHLLDDRRGTGLLEHLPQAGAQLVADLPEVAEGRAAVFVEDLQAGARRAEADARRVLRAVVQDAAPGERLHDLRAADEGRHREAAPERLAERRDVGIEAVVLLAATGRDAEAGDRLVEDEEDAVHAGEFAQLLEVARFRRDHADVRHDPFGDDRRHLPAVRFDRALDGLQVVPRYDDRVVERVAVQPRAVRDADRIAAMTERRDWLRVGVDEEVVVPPVVVALELDELRPAGVAARQAQRGHRRLGSGVREPHALGAPNHVLQQLRDLNLDLGGRGEQRPRGGGLGNRRHHFRMRMTERQRAVGNHPVDVLVAVGVPDPRAAGPLDEQRILAVVGGTPRGRAAALDHDAHRAIEQRFRLRSVVCHRRDFADTALA